MNSLSVDAGGKIFPLGQKSGKSMFGGQTSKWFSFHHLAHTSALFMSTNSCLNFPSNFSSLNIYLTWVYFAF